MMHVEARGKTLRELLWMLDGFSEMQRAMWGKPEEATMPYNPATLAELQAQMDETKA